MELWGGGLQFWGGGRLRPDLSRASSSRPAPAQAAGAPWRLQGPGLRLCHS